MNFFYKEDERDRKEKKAIVISLLFLFLGFGLLWLAKSILKMEGETVFISLLFIPIIIYVITSGKLEQLKGPGGLEAKFAKTADEKIIIQSDKVIASVEEMQIVKKESIEVLEIKKKEINENQPIVMIMEIGKSDYYKRKDVISYIEFLSQFRNFKFIVFIDDQKKFAAFMPFWSLKGLLSKNNIGDEFIDLINEGHKSDLLRYPGIVIDTIRINYTNAQALKEMTKQNLEALVVTDEANMLKGVVEREQVLSRMMLSLTK